RSYRGRSIPTRACPIPDQESSQVRSAWIARTYDGIEHPANPSAARRSWPRWSSTLFDDLVGPQQQRLRNREAECLGGLEVDDQLELRRLLDGEIGGPHTLEDPVHVRGNALGQIEHVAAVRH